VHARAGVKRGEKEGVCVGTFSESRVLRDYCVVQPQLLFPTNHAPSSRL